MQGGDPPGQAAVAGHAEPARRVRRDGGHDPQEHGRERAELEQRDQLTAIDGVDVVVPAVTMIASEIQGVSFGPPDQVYGVPFGADQGRETYAPAIAVGRALSAEDEGREVAVLGSSIAAKRAASVGGTITV